MKKRSHTATQGVAKPGIVGSGKEYRTAGTTRQGQLVTGQIVSFPQGSLSALSEYARQVQLR
jgi:hypothetical protein